MRYLEVRRHSIRTKPGKHLSQEGVDLARKVGNSMGPFFRVITSTAPRAFETAIAMGFAVDEELGELNDLSEEVSKKMVFDSGFKGFVQALEREEMIQKFSRSQSKLWASIFATVPDEKRVLVISHLGIIEAGLIASLPKIRFSSWGSLLDCCEGALLSFEDQTFVGGEMLRVR